MSNGASPGSPPSNPTGTGSTSQPETLPPKFDDPCKAYVELRDRRQELISGTGLAEFEYHGNGTERRLKYNLANLNALDQDIREAQAACAAKIGAPNPGRRFALTVGPGRDNYPPAMRWSARLGYY